MRDGQASVQRTIYLLDMAYPDVSRMAFPHIEQRPFLYAQPEQHGR